MINIATAPIQPKHLIRESLIGAFIVSFPNIICFYPEWDCLCTPECRAIHACYFLLRFMIFASAIMLGINRYGQSVKSVKLNCIIGYNILICAAAYSITLLISIPISQYIFTDARGSILVFQFIMAAIITSGLTVIHSIKKEESITADIPQKQQYILIGKGDKILPIPVDNIAYIYSSNRKTSITTVDGKSHSYNKSLDKTMEQLSESMFFRANKQYIVQKKAVSEMTVWFDSRLLIRIKTLDTPEPIYVSKNKSAQFKKWIEE